MQTVLVLGGTGFIGHHIVKRLVREGFRVRVLARPGGDRSLLSTIDVDIHDGDIRHARDIKAALAGCDGLIHAAAHYPVWSIDPEREEDIGRQQILRVHEALHAHPVERFVYVSTLTAVGRYRDGRPEDEDAPFPEARWRSTYARVKREMQELVHYNARRTNAVIVAPTGVFGPGDRKPTTGRIILDIAVGRMPVTLHGRTNAVSVFAVADGIVRALEHGRVGRLYVLGGENLTLMDLSTRIARIVGAKPPRAALTPELIWPVAWAGEHLAQRLGHAAPPLPLVGVDFARYGEFISSDVARRELGYDPTAHPLSDALRKAWDWFRARGG